MMSFLYKKQYNMPIHENIRRTIVLLMIIIDFLS